MRARGLGAVAVLLAAAIGGGAERASSDSHRPCQVRGSVTVAASSTVRMYTVRQPYEDVIDDRDPTAIASHYGCLLSSGRPVLLRRLDEGKFDGAFETAATRGRFTALATNDREIHNERANEGRAYVSTIDIHDLGRRRRIKSCFAYYGTAADPGFRRRLVDSSTQRLLVSARGHVAWISAGPGRRVEVHKYDSRGHHLLDAGTSIPRRSLELTRSGIRWTSGDGTTRRRRFNARPGESDIALPRHCSRLAAR